MPKEEYPSFELTNPGQGGFDSTEQRDDWFAIPSFERSLGLLTGLVITGSSDGDYISKLRAAACTDAKCETCGKQLFSMSFSLDHHTGFGVDNTIHHYCAEHCPNCSGADEDAA